MPYTLTPLSISLIIFVTTFAMAYFGMVLHRKLPKEHLTEETKDVIKLLMGFIATMTPLVLGLLIASAKSSFDTQNGELQQAVVNVVELDGILAHYGSDASDARQRLRELVASAAEKIWPRNGSVLSESLRPAAGFAEADLLYDSIASLSPRTEAQKFIQSRALSVTSSLRNASSLILEQMGSSIPWLFLVVLVLWILMLFAGFGLFAKLNTTIVVAFIIGALTVSSSIFLILEMDDPYGGLIHISDQTLRNALAPNSH